MSLRRGEPLVLLDERDLAAARARADASHAAATEGAAAAEAERQAAEAAGALARATHNRIAALRSRNSATPQELDEATAALRAADARTRAARARVDEATAAIEAARAASQATRVAASYAVLTAPFDGVVTEKLVEPGNMAMPGAPLLTLEDTGGFQLEIDVDASRAAFLALGAPVQVLFDSTWDGAGLDSRWDAAGAAIGTTGKADLAGPPSEAIGHVAEIARAIQPGSHAFVVKVDLPPHTSDLEGPPYRSGMFGRARFAGPSRRVLTVPAAGVVRRGQLAFVFVVDAEARARLRAVSLGEPSGDRVEALAGIVGGERLVLDPPPALADGTPLRERSTGGRP